MTFSEHYTPDNPPTTSDDPVVDQVDELSPGFAGFMREFSGVSFDKGIYRVHAIENIRVQTALCLEAFPSFENSIVCFASDWHGRQYVIDLTAQSGQRNILVMDSGRGDVHEFTAVFMDFHNRVLADHREDALTESFFREWIDSGGRAPAPNECVGYKIPLFFNGEDSVENLELIDMEVYWSIHAQLLEQIKDLPPGTKVNVTGIE